MVADVQYASSATPTYFPHLTWHPMYSLAQDAVKGVLNLYVGDLYTKMKMALTIKKQKR